MKLSFDWVIGVVEIDISDCSVENVNRLVEEIEDNFPSKTCEVVGTSLLLDTCLLEDAFRHLSPSTTVSVLAA